MTTPGSNSWLPSVEQARGAAAHLRWVLRRRRANKADRTNRPFRYSHPDIGPFVYHPRDYLSRRVFLHNDFEREELRFAMEAARRGGVILDVGANIGLYAAACARAAGARGRVFAIEPGPSAFEKLTTTCRLLKLSTVTPVAVAIGRTNGLASLVSGRFSRDVHRHLSDTRWYDDEERVSVELRRLDDLCGADADFVTLLKIDIEGHEVAALEGAERVLRGGGARVIVEVYPRALAAAGSSAGALWALLSRTHDCVALVCEDGSRRQPVQKSVDVDGVFNAFWVPRRL
jgi:FkbM family methyltransferase